MHKYYTHCRIWSKQLAHKRMPSSVCTASLSNSLHSGQIRAALWGSVVSYPGMIYCSFGNSKQSLAKYCSYRKNRNQHIFRTFYILFYFQVPAVIPCYIYTAQRRPHPLRNLTPTSGSGALVWSAGRRYIWRGIYNYSTWSMKGEQNMVKRYTAPNWP